ncbi:helix-turn-helix domain-containing protein [Candidatus Roseilinea sp. NK_OTU-006]|jgi:tetratricopeptide (TPR) repeat protein|uniref:helix-turn-helix domain-containing protein n=1 Tax=Candidatus Roseilinea sp. NK_OTU-006 TaxID=2704250 RepID=UPI00145E15DD|nr:helix-turn-helix transcriptional regulator [Candidatus Roseilinea sp. NK_OTU-006]
MGSTADWSWINEELRQRGMSRTKLAHLLGVSTPAVSKWIKGEQNPNYEHLPLLAALFAGGDLNRLYHRAGFRWGEMLQHLDAQARGTGIRPAATSHGQDDLVTLHFPSEALQAQDAVTATLTAESVLASNALLRQANRFAEMRDQSKRLIARLTGSRSPLTDQMWYALADAELMLGNYYDSLDAADAARRLARGAVSDVLVADAYGISAEAWRIMGNWAQARSHCNEARRLYLKAGLPHAEGQMWIDWNLGRVATSEGNYDEALEHFDRMAAMAQRLGHGGGALLQRYGVAMLADLQGKLSDTLDQYAPMQRDVHRDGNAYWDAMALWKMADVLRRQGDVVRAVSMAQQAIHIYEALDNADLVASVTFTLGYCQIHLGKAEPAREAFASVTVRSTHGVDQSTVRMARIGERFALLARTAAQDNPCFDELLPLITPDATDATLPRLNLRFELLEALFVAEAMRLNNRAAMAHDHYATIARRAAKHDHPLEHAHALLGLAEAKRMLGQPDRETPLRALAIYEGIGAAWGQVHACIAQALIEPCAASRQLQEAKRIAQACAFRDDLALIERLQTGARRTEEHHALTFA